MLVPKTGNIYICGTFVGYRDPVTLVFTPIALVEALPLKVHSYTSDEFLMLEPQNELTEENTNAAGTLVMNYREIPTYNDNTNDIYHSVQALDDFSGQSPLMGNTSILGNNQCIYFNRTGFGEDLFKTDKEWAISIFWESGTTLYICGRAAGANGTSLWQTGGNFYVSVGNVDLLIGAIDGSKPHGVEWKNTFNGSDWADELWLDGVMEYTNRTTGRGTLNGDAPASIGAVYNGVVTDPVNDALRGNGASEVMGIRISSTAPVNAREMSGLYYREKKYFLNVISGDSIAFGINGTPDWWQSTRDNAEEANFRTQWINKAVPSRTCYSGMPVTPATGFVGKGPWVVGSRPVPESNLNVEHLIDAFDPDRALISFSSNEFASGTDYTEYNPSGAGSLGLPPTLGYNGPADEFLYCHKSMEAKFAEFNIPMLWTTTHPVNDTTLTTVANIPRNEVHAIVSDTIEADVDLTNVVIINRTLREGETLYNYNPALDDDGTHPNTPGHAEDTILIEDVSDPVWEATRDTYWDSELIITYPTEGEVVTEQNIIALYTTDGTERTQPETLTLGPNTIDVSYTNSKGRQSMASVTFTYSNV